MSEQKPDPAFQEQKRDPSLTGEEEENQRPKKASASRKKERAEVTQQVRVRTQEVRVRGKSKSRGIGGAIASFFRLVLILVLILVCLAVAAGVLAGDRLPGLAAEKFGPPSPGLSLPQRVLYSARLLISANSLTTPYDPQGKPRSFQVPLGETVNSIATRLEEEQFISNADTFRTYLIYAGLDKGVQAGDYELSPAMTMVQIAHALQDAAPKEVKFNILPGWRTDEIAAALPTSGLAVEPQAFMEIVRNPPADMLPYDLLQVTSLEGFLAPGSYTIKRDISARDLAALFVNHFEESITPEMRDAFTKHNLNLDQAVTLASIVQREAVVADEQPVIASVFYNRLENGMKLDSDPTVQYALGYDMDKHTWWKNPLTQADLQVNSRYNTYINPGLPPGPIANPGIDALRAVAFPAQTDFFYFRAKCDGSGLHAFSKTYEEHLQNACP